MTKAAQTQAVASETVVTEAKKFDISALLAEHTTKSAVIRYLASQNLDTKGIHKLLTEAGWKSDKSGTAIRYQHVRNVLTQELKKPVTVATAK